MLRFLHQDHRGGKDLRLLIFASILIDKVWRARSELLFEGKQFDILRLHQQIIVALSEFESVLPRAMLIGVETHWISPPKGWYKCYVDVAVSEQLSLNVDRIRDYQGSSSTYRKVVFH